MPDSLAPLWHSGIAESYIDGQFHRFVEKQEWSPGAAGSIVNPLTLQRHVVDDLRPYLRALEDYLRPGDQTIIAMRIEALLSHWSVPERPEAVADVVAGDWVRVIGNYPLWCVLEAANHWLEFEVHRPTIAAIKRLCDEAVYEARLRLRVLSKVEGK